MADAAAARREARRKRILENSHNRLQLISGKSGEDGVRESTNNSPVSQPYEAASVSHSELSNSFTLLNGILGPEVLSPGHDAVAAGDGETVSEFVPFAPSPAPEQTQKPLWKTLVTKKYDIVLLSLLLQLLYGYFSVSHENTNLLHPLIIYTVTKLIWFPDQSNSSIRSALLILNGLSANRLHKMLQILLLVGTFGQDMCIYLFIIITCQSLYNTISTSIT